ncbi:unnamed protein product [Cladocopium goreaui]|uniref:Transposon protein n=1 Tax=Cladocopium goreaui TaxID=2562237 RepID=A0A9P1G7I8_9DINO|nr:unnamed protein product [Cladocopium goreaui]
MVGDTAAPASASMVEDAAAPGLVWHTEPGPKGKLRTASTGMGQEQLTQLAACWFGSPLRKMEHSWASMCAARVLQLLQGGYIDGERGFLPEGLKDLRLWLEVEACHAEEVKASTGSVSQSLDAELAELRSDPAERRFLTYGMVCKQVAFLRTQHDQDVPSALVSRFLAPEASKRFVSRFADRILPVDLSSQPKAESFSRQEPNVLAAHAGRQWRLLYEPFRGGWNTISREDAFEACKEILGADSQSAPALARCSSNSLSFGLSGNALEIFGTCWNAFAWMPNSFLLYTL